MVGGWRRLAVGGGRLVVPKGCPSQNTEVLRTGLVVAVMVVVLVLLVRTGGTAPIQATQHIDRPRAVVAHDRKTIAF